MPNELEEHLLTIRNANATTEPLAAVQERLAKALVDYITHPAVSAQPARLMTKLVLLIQEGEPE